MEFSGGIMDCFWRTCRVGFCTIQCLGGEAKSIGRPLGPCIIYDKNTFYASLKKHGAFSYACVTDREVLLQN